MKTPTLKSKSTMSKKTVARLGARIDRVRAYAKRNGIPAVEIGRRAIAGLLSGKRISSGMIVQKEIRADAYAIIERLAKDAGLSVDAFFAAAGGYTFVTIPTKTARRFREVEDAASLEPGAILDSLIEYGEGWWDGNFDELPGHMEGFDLADEKKVLANLKVLGAKWAREDAGESIASDRERLTFDVCRGTATALRKLAAKRKTTVECVGQMALMNEAGKSSLNAADFRRIGNVIKRAERAERATPSEIELPVDLIRAVTKMAKAEGLTISEFTEALIWKNGGKFFAKQRKAARSGKEGGK
jgi:hypothetical protein